MLNTLRVGGIFRWMTCALAIAIGMAASGCNILGWLANASPPADIKPAYEGLKGETVAIWVYADQAAQLDFPHIEDDLAGAIQSHLESDSADLAKTRFQSVQKLSDYRRMHAELRGKPPTEFAANLGVTRVVYVEVRNFSTRSSAVSADLFLGRGVADVRVIEVDPKQANAAKLASWKEESISARFPEQVGEKESIGEQESGDINAQKVYVGTIQALGLEIAERFYQHAAPDYMDAQ